MSTAWPRCFPLIPLVLVAAASLGPAQGAVGQPSPPHRMVPAEAWRWSTVETPGPYLSGYAWAYDPLRERTVLFGGSRAVGLYTDETWEWDGVEWVRRFPVQSPPPLAAAAMCFDPVRGTVLLFGGWAMGPYPKPGRDETWEWDGRTWARVATAVAPPGRGTTRMSHDPVRQRIVLFGGMEWMGWLGAFGALEDTWEWDGSGWTQVMAPGPVPTPRGGQGQAYDPRTNSTLLFSGGNTGRIYDDTWSFDGRSWTLLAPSRSPGGRSGHGMATDTRRGRVMLYGGTTFSSGVTDTWEWTGTDWRLLSPQAVPTERPYSTPALVYDTARDRMVVPLVWSTWEFDGATWRAADAWEVPLTAQGVGDALCYDPVRGEALLVTLGGPTGGTWTWSAGRWRPRPLASAGSPGPPPGRFRSGFDMVFDAGTGHVLFVGNNVIQNANVGMDTWLWDGTRWTEDARPSPPARSSVRLAYDSRRQRAVLFSGRASLDDTWEWDAAGGWQEARPAVRPPPRVSGVLGYDPSRGRTVLFGGTIPNPPWGLQDTWEWDGVAWTRMQPATVPPLRAGWLMEYVPALGGLVLFGGAEYLNSSWLWDGTDWRLLGAGPQSSDRFDLPVASTFDTRRQRILAVRRNRWPLWEYAAPSLRADNASPGPGSRITFRVDLQEQAGLPFLLALSRGTHPGIPVRVVPGAGVEHLPLQPDALFGLSLGMGLTTVLDSLGQGWVRLRMPSDPALARMRFFAAGLTLDTAGGVGAATNEVPVVYVP